MNASVPTASGISVEVASLSEAMMSASPGLELPDVVAVERFVADLRDGSSDFVSLANRYGSDVSALRHVGLLHWEGRRLDLALQALSAAVVIAPDDSRLWADLAGIYDGQSRPDAAETCIRRALALDPDNAKSWQCLGSLVDRRGARRDAEMAYRESLRIDPKLGDAHFGLGILQFNEQRIDDSIASLRAAIAHGYDNGLGHTCLGHVLYRSSDFQGCASAFETAATFGPLAANARRQFARARTFATIVEGRTEEALNTYPDLAGDDQEDSVTILYDAFSLLSAYGYRAAAIDVGQRRLAEKPDDPIQKYLLDAVEGRPLKAAPADYIESYFDRFAPEFDRKLVDVLHYDTPERLQALVARHRDRFDAMLDLGCGTGLAAEPLAAFGSELTGVDLSSRMLEEAAKRGRYGALVKSEAIAYLDGGTARFDLIFAADLVVYIGDIEPLMLSVSRALVPSGLFAFNIETAAHDDFALLPSGRFAHAVAYIERVAAQDFDRLDIVQTRIRLEANRPVEGHLIVLRRR